MCNIKVSVIMAVYNGERYLSKALDTIISQSLKEIEIICVDDGSTDQTVSILEEYAKRDQRIMILHHYEKTDGAAAARNMGMSVAKGEYLAFFDADDFFAEDLLEKTYKRAMADKSDIVLYDAFVFDDIVQKTYKVDWLLNKGNIPSQNFFVPKDNRNKLFQMTMGAAWLALFRRDMILNNDIQFESIHHTDDQVFVCLAYCCAKRISVLDERLVYYRKNVPTSQSANAGLHPEAGYMAASVLKRELEERGLYKIYGVSVAVLGMNIAEWHLKQMVNVNDFMELYWQLKNRYFKELGIMELNESFVDKSLIQWRDDILSLEPIEYLLKKSNSQKNDISIILKKLPYVPINAKVIIYGGGVFGRWLFSHIQEKQLYKIVSWVDRNYEELGFPFRSVNSILVEEFDFILVAIKKEDVFLSIKEDLMKMGVPEQNICWINEIE